MCYLKGKTEIDLKNIEFSYEWIIFLKREKYFDLKMVNIINICQIFNLNKKQNKKNGNIYCFFHNFFKNFYGKFDLNLKLKNIAQIFKIFHYSHLFNQHQFYFTFILFSNIKK